MATIANQADTLLQATSPRVATVPLPTNVTVDLSSVSQVINNLNSYSRVTGLTTLATQTALSYGGTYLNGFGQLAPLNALDRNSSVYFFNTMSGDKITAGTLTVDKLMSGSQSSYSGFRFGLNVNHRSGDFYCAGNFTSNVTRYQAIVAQHFNDGSAIGATTSATTLTSEAAGLFAGGFVDLGESGASVLSQAWLGRGPYGGSFANFSGVAGALTSQVHLGTPTYGIDLDTGKFRYQGVVIQPPSGNPAHTLKGDGTWS